MSLVGRNLPQGIQEKGKEIRTFMPRYGCINERRNQLHEVIRLSGMNLIINDTDHPLIIKVASIQAARMQVYFIDNEDYFYRKSVLKEALPASRKSPPNRGLLSNRITSCPRPAKAPVRPGCPVGQYPLGFPGRPHKTCVRRPPDRPSYRSGSRGGATPEPLSA